MAEARGHAAFKDRRAGNLVGGDEGEGRLKRRELGVGAGERS